MRRHRNLLRNHRQTACRRQPFFQFAYQLLRQHVFHIIRIAIDMVTRNAGAFDQKQLPQPVRSRHFGRGHEAGGRQLDVAVHPVDQLLRFQAPEHPSQ